MAVQGENTVFMFNYEKIEWTKPTGSLGCHNEITICPFIGALVSHLKVVLLQRIACRAIVNRIIDVILHLKLHLLLNTRLYYF